MKKFIPALCIIFGTLSCFAQNSAGTQLSVQLNNIQSIKINEAQGDVLIALNTASEYLNGKSTAQANHIEIMSSANYEVKVSASTHLQGESASININTITITPSLGSIGGIPTGSMQLTPTPLALSENTLVQSSQGDIQRSFNINYRVSGGSEYLNKPIGTYSTLVTYTIMTQ